MPICSRRPAYALFNLDFHYDLSASEANRKNFRIFFEIQNLFNTTYIASANNVSDSINPITGAAKSGERRCERHRLDLRRRTAHIHRRHQAAVLRLTVGLEQRRHSA